MLILAAYAVFFVLAILLFARLNAHVAAVALYFGGWLLLPVAIYPRDTMTANYFTVDVIGAGLPSNLGVTKAVVIPLAILVAWAAWHGRRWTLPRPTLPDLAMAGFCLWPLAGALVPGRAVGAALHDALYLSASWGASWIIGRLLLSDPAARLLLLRGAAWSGVALLPIALTEGVAGPWVYRALWGDHAFLMEGARRTVGYRPLGFFEHGNQYALWLALSAFAWLILTKLQVIRPMERVLALAIVAALAVAQSVGAIVLLVAATGVALVPATWLRRMALLGGAMGVMLGAVYLAGVIPAERMAHNDAFKQMVAVRFGTIRLSSLFYRIRRDQMAIPMLKQLPLTGTARWDWWRPLGSHPWGLPLLLTGQFGVVALLLLVLALLTAPIRALFRDDRASALCALLVLVAAADSFFNSFVYFPAVLFAATLTSAGRVGRKALT